MPRRLGIVTILALAWCITMAQLHAQNLGGKATIKPIKGFKVAEPYPPPHETQTKSLLEGGRALPQPGGKSFLSEGVVLRTFSETNTPQLIVKCDDCVYDSKTREVNSAGRIQMQTADGKFTIEGIGFFWRQTNSSLVISNQVHTLIQSASFPQGTNTVINPAGPESGPIVIDSRKFSYDGPSGRGVWLEHVHVTGTNLDLTSEMLTATVPADQQQARSQREVRSLLAQTNVVVKYNGLDATGGRLTYSPDNGLIRLTEQAKWRAEQRHGYGDELVLDRTNQIFQVNGHAALYLPGQTLGESGFLSFSNSVASHTTNSVKRVIEILCANYEIRTNWAAFRDQVQLNEQLDSTNRGRMTCQKGMTVTFAGTNQLETLTAEQNVVIEEGDKRFTGGRAFYTHTNTTLELTVHPAWQDGLRSGKGDLLRLNSQLSEMLVQGNASMTLPANQLAAQNAPLSTSAATNRVAVARTNEFAQIFCEKYILRPEKSVFQGGVYVTHPEMNWTCENLAVLVSNSGITNVVAQQNVMFDLVAGNSKVHGTGDQAVYSFGLLNTVTNGMRPLNELRLTGTPAALVTTNLSMQNNNVMTNRNSVIVWDRLRDKLILPGTNYLIQGTAPAVDTNIFLLPKKKATK